MPTDSIVTDAVARKAARKIRKAALQLVKLALIREDRGLDHGAWVHGVQELQRALGRPPRCRSCGCTDDKACKDGCRWVDAGLCSACATKVI